MKRLALLVLVGCNTPVPTIKLALSGGPTQACASTDCSGVTMSCPTVLSVRILDPNDPTAPYLSQCTSVTLDNKQDLCALASIPLDASKIPVRTLEVQVAVYPASVIPADPMTGDLQCPTNVQYDSVWGFPIDQDPTPALGGHTFYHPGDSEVVVTLGCTDPTAINDASCAAAKPIMINGTVEDWGSIGFQTIDAGTANRLTVAVGEPQPAGSAYVLNPGDERDLMRTASPVPSWSNDVNLTFNQVACLDVRDAVATESTATLHCSPANNATSYDLSGVLLSVDTLHALITALGLPRVPDSGMTIGIVLDENGNPQPNFTVSTTNGTVRYLAADMASFTGNVTSTTGVFASTDAEFGAVFSTAKLGEVVMGKGGRVQGKVTIVVLQFKHLTM